MEVCSVFWAAGFLEAEFWEDGSQEDGFCEFGFQKLVWEN